jgi:7,8-dihydropterin-6-yl-methyl-4-(beta-D-ribofuranosyl)aminobenzene 5'-phosphate synthase
MMASGLSLTVLVDTAAPGNPDNAGGAGLTFLLETAGKKILFDTGQSGLFLANAGKMGIDLSDLDFLVLTQGHSDHTGGLPVLIRPFVGPGGKPSRAPHLIAHPRCFWQKEEAGRKNGSTADEGEVKRQFPTILSEKPVWITSDLVFLGEIPKRFVFEQEGTEKQMHHLPDGNTEPDHLFDDTALAFRSAEGLVIITGCSHAGICNITEYAREVCGEKNVRDIIGGLHLLSPEPKRFAKTGKYLNRLHLSALHACHCTSPSVKHALADYCPVQEVSEGMRIEW